MKAQGEGVAAVPDTCLGVPRQCHETRLKVTPPFDRGAPSVETHPDDLQAKLGILMPSLQYFFAAFCRSSFLATHTARTPMVPRASIVRVMSHPIGSILFSIIQLSPGYLIVEEYTLNATITTTKTRQHMADHAT